MKRIPALVSAVRQNDEKRVLRLLDKGGAAEQLDAALVAAIATGNAALLRLLMVAGAANGATPLTLNHSRERARC